MRKVRIPIRSIVGTALIGLGTWGAVNALVDRGKFWIDELLVSGLLLFIGVRVVWKRPARSNEPRKDSNRAE